MRAPPTAVCSSRGVRRRPRPAVRCQKLQNYANPGSVLYRSPSLILREAVQCRESRESPRSGARNGRPSAASRRRAAADERGVSPRLTGAAATRTARSFSDRKPPRRSSPPTAAPADASPSRSEEEGGGKSRPPSNHPPCGWILRGPFRLTASASPASHFDRRRFGASSHAAACIRTRIRTRPAAGLG